MSGALTPAKPIRLHRSSISGHSHRAELFLSLLGLPFEAVEVDMRRGEQKSPAFLALNPFGEVPVIEDGDLVLADSNAIMVYLESRYAPGQWLPRDPIEAARVQRWLSASAGPLAWGPAVARVLKLFNRPENPAPFQKRARDLFSVMEQELTSQQFLVGDKPTLADIAMYTYTALAPDGGIELEAWPEVCKWLTRIESLPGFVPMPNTPSRPGREPST
jgi:glutathione S-transferase